jgi:murein L,D-transpeptidase YafK
MTRRLSSLGALSALLLSVVVPAPADAAPRLGVSRVLVKKGEHLLELRAREASGDERVVASYKVAIGPGGAGPKRREGDMTTPVGRYHVVSHEASQYKTFLRLDYPTSADYKLFNLAKSRGDLPPSAKIGSDIGIHGPPVSLNEAARAHLKERDWTAGCVAVDDDEITEIARLVRDGTVVDIEP